MSNDLTRVRVDARVTKSTLVDALMDLYDDEFDHRHWSLSEAEFFEKLAKRIRDGYAETHPSLTLTKP